MDYVKGFIWYSDTDRDHRRKVNEAVSETDFTAQELEIKRRALTNKCEKLQGEIEEAEELGDEMTMQIKNDQYEQCQDEIAHLDAIRANMGIQKMALDRAAVNANVYETQKSASDALEHVNSQMKEQDVMRTNTKLQANIDRTDSMSKAMTRPLKSRKPIRKPTKTDSVHAKIAQWKTQKMPTVVKQQNNDNNVVVVVPPAVKKI